MLRLTPRLAALVVALACGSLAGYLALNARDASWVHEANEHGAAGQLRQALDLAARVHHAPEDTRALLVRATALTKLGRRAEADAAWAALARRDPNNWQVHLGWSRALFTLGGDQIAAVRHYARARALNPRLPALGEG